MQGASRGVRAKSHGQGANFPPTIPSQVEGVGGWGRWVIIHQRPTNAKRQCPGTDPSLSPFPYPFIMEQVVRGAAVQPRGLRSPRICETCGVFRSH